MSVPVLRDDDARWSHVIALLLAAGEDDDLGDEVAEVDEDDDATRRPG
jgi:hypothetical protein